MYDYRRMSSEQRSVALRERRSHGLPWHSPPHFLADGQYSIVTGACYEHRKILNSQERMTWFEGQLLESLRELCDDVATWVVLPNHYHALARIANMKEFTRGLGYLHGRTSFELNQQDDRRGRRVWYRCQDRCMRSEAHYWTTVNYIHNNPVKHGYVTKGQEWVCSSVHEYLDSKGRDWMVQLWQEFPVLKYGEKWDVF